MPASAPVRGALASSASASPLAMMKVPAGSGVLSDSLAQAEYRLILEVLRTYSTREQAAAHLGISARTLRYKLARMRAAGLLVDEDGQPA